MSYSLDVVIFGGFGDLSLRKLMPALYRSVVTGQLDDQSKIFLTSRSREAGDDGSGYDVLVAEVESALKRYLKEGEYDTGVWQRFSRMIQPVELDITQSDGAWTAFAEALQSTGNSTQIFYLAIPPDLYGTSCERLNEYKLISEQSRIVLEKPIGYDLDSAKRVNQQVAEYFEENQIYRIDHYLGKETVQNVLALRFTNTLFEQLWDNKSIDNVQITISETVGLEGRAAFYDQAGALRDMVQNHLLQLLCLLTMEPPNKMTADNIRAEKLKVMQALRPIVDDDVAADTVRGQYTNGKIGDERVLAYTQELQDDSSTETFVAIRAHIENWRWARVPFYLRTGKRMKERFAEIVVQYKPVSHRVYPDAAGSLQPNALIIRLQPDEKISLSLMTKELDNAEFKLKPVALDLDFADTYDSNRDAYKRLILDVAEGNASLFAHRDEIEEAWTWLSPIQEAWKRPEHEPHLYPAGSWGPAQASELLKRDGRKWLHGIEAASRES